MKRSIERFIGRFLSPDDLPPPGSIVYLKPPPNDGPEAKRLQKLYNNCMAGRLEKPDVKLEPIKGRLGVDDPDWIRPGTALEMDQKEYADGRKIVYLEKIDEPKYHGHLFKAYVETEDTSDSSSI